MIPAMAEATSSTRWPSRAFRARPATAEIPASPATEVPPNFITRMPLAPDGGRGRGLIESLLSMACLNKKAPLVSGAGWLLCLRP